MNKYTSYILDFNRNLYQKELHQLQEQVDALNASEKLFEGLTDKVGKPIKSITDLESHLRNSTGFANIYLASDAMGLKDEYQEVIRLEDFAKIEKRLVSKKEGVYSLKDTVRDEIKEKWTTYLDDKKRPAYDKVLEAVNHMNSLPTESRSCLRMGLDAKWHVNLHRFNEGAFE